jgi:hypothetical protein
MASAWGRAIARENVAFGAARDGSERSGNSGSGGVLPPKDAGPKGPDGLDSVSKRKLGTPSPYARSASNLAVSVA